MSILKNLIKRSKQSSGQAFDDYTQAYLGPEGAAFLPTKTEYDIAVNRAAARVPSQTLEGTFPGILGQALGTASDVVMPALALGSSPFYDLTQAASRARGKYGEPDVLSIVGDDEIPVGPSLPQYAKAVADENILRSAIGRTAGAGQNLADRFGKIAGGLENFFFAPAGAGSDLTTSSNIPGQRYTQMASPRSLGAEEIETPENRGILDILKSGAAGARDIFLQGAGATGGLNIGAKTGVSLFGPELALPFGIAGAVLGSKFTEMGPSGAFYEGLTEDQQAAVDQIYGDKGIMAGYNPVSRFGRGAAGAIDKRIGNIMETLRKQELEGKVSDVLEKRQRELQAERDRITGTIRDAAGNITGGTGQGTIDSGNEGGYGGTGGEGPSAVGSSGMLGGGV